MNKDDVRLNKAKRDAIKKAWRDITLKTPTQKDDALLNLEESETFTFISNILNYPFCYYPINMGIINCQAQNQNNLF